MINAERSYTEYDVKVPTTDFPIGFDILDDGIDVVAVTLNDVDPTTLGYTVTQVNSTTYRFAPAVPSGVVRLTRITDIDRMTHVFTEGAIFLSENMDGNFKQIRHAQQEVRDEFSKLRADIGFTNLEQTITQVQATYQDTLEAKNAAEHSATAAVVTLATVEVQANLTQDYANAANAAKDIAQQSATDATTQVGTLKIYVDDAVGAISTDASKQYATLALATADIADIAVNQNVFVSEAANGGYWYKATAGATSLVKSAYDPLTQAKAEMNANANFNPVKIGNVSLDTLIKVGQYFATDVAPATPENNYPLLGLTGVVHVAKAQTSSLIFQEFRAATGMDYWRSFNGTVWTAWKLKVDLSLFEPKSTAFTDLGVLTSELNLNDLQSSGRYALTDGTAWASTSQNFPKNGISGILEVVKNTASSIVSQRFTSWESGTPTVYFRLFRSVWSPWVALTSSIKDSGLIDAMDDLNTIKASGFYIKNTVPPAEFATLGYPVQLAGKLVVYKSSSSSLVYQAYTTTTLAVYERYFNGTAWSAWVNTSVNATNYAKIAAVFSASMNANDLRTEFSFYIVNNINLDLATTNLPVQANGVLKVHKGTVSSLCVQQFVTVSGAAYTRYWNNITWSAWINPLDNIAPSSGSDTLQFTKTATALTWYLPNTGNGTNKIRHTYVRGIVPENNRDSWGMGTAAVVSASNATVLNLTTSGVWEVAIVDSQNIADHSGGGHGDEVKSLSYFLVDGIYKSEDFVENFTAKEVKHIQRSTIYVEAQNIPVCIRETTWTFTKEKSTSHTRLIFPEVRTINKARIAMLPIYRKASSDGTGAQVTDKEIRSQDLTPIDVTVHDFPRRDLPIADGDSVLLSSDVAKISAEVIVKKIKAVAPHAYVQNTIAYNKVYVNAFAEDAPAHITTVGEVWEVETDFVIKVSG